MQLLNQIFAIIFYILFSSWAFIKIRNIMLINKLNCKEIYKNIKEDSKNQKMSKYLFKIIITVVIILSIYLAIGLILGILSYFMIFVTLGGALYVDTGANSTFFDNFMNLIVKYFSLLKYIGYYLYIIVYMVLGRSIYINISCNKVLKLK